MFDIAWSEIAVVVVVALIFLGPEEVPKIVRMIKKTSATLKGFGNEFVKTMEEIGQEVDVKTEAERINAEIKQIVDLEGNLQDTYDISDLLKEQEEKQQSAPPKDQRPS